MMNLQGAPAWTDIDPDAHLSDAWILSRLNRTIRQVTECLSEYRFHEAVTSLYRYMWNDFCDWYLEVAKVRMAGGEAAPKAVVAHALDVLLRLLQPFIPFITEEIWGQLNAVAPYRGPGDAAAEPLLVRAAWPRAESRWISEAVERRFDMLRELISGVREARSRHNVPAGTKVRLTVAAAGDDEHFIADSAALICALANVENVQMDAQAQPSGADATVLAGNVRALVRDVIDREAELARLTGQAETLQKGIRGIQAKLANEGFVTRAPADVVQREEQRLQKLQAELAAVARSLEALK